MRIVLKNKTIPFKRPFLIKNKHPMLTVSDNFAFISQEQQDYIFEKAAELK